MTIQIRILAAAALAALLAAGPAAAQRSNWYIGGGIGQARADFVTSDFSPWLESGTYTHDDNAFAMGGVAGHAGVFACYTIAPAQHIGCTQRYVAKIANRRRDDVKPCIQRFRQAGFRHGRVHRPPFDRAIWGRQA